MKVSPKKTAILLAGALAFNFFQVLRWSAYARFLFPCGNDGGVLRCWRVAAVFHLAWNWKACLTSPRLATPPHSTCFCRRRTTFHRSRPCDFTRGLTFHETEGRNVADCEPAKI